MDFIIEQLLTWWQFTVVGVLIIIGYIINLIGVDQDEPIVHLKYDEMPTMIPIKIPTAGKGFWSAIWMWLTGVRTWKLVRTGTSQLMGKTM